MGVTVVALWSATMRMNRDTLEALSAGALDVEGYTTLESTLRSLTSLTGCKLTPLLFQPLPCLRPPLCLRLLLCLPRPVQCLPLLCLRLPPMCQRRLPLKNGLPLKNQGLPLKSGPPPMSGLPLLCHRRQPEKLVLTCTNLR